MLCHQWEPINGLVTIQGCTIDGNPSVGIASTADNVAVSKTMVRGNGTGIFNHESPNWSIVNSLIQQNGQAIRIWGTHLVVVNSDVISNSVPLVFMESEQAYFLNSIIWHNSKPKIDVLGVASLFSADACFIQGGQASIQVETGARLRWGAGNLAGEPGLTFSGDWPTLSPKSACLGGGMLSIPGLEAVTTAPPDDAMSSARPSPSGTHPDIGAIESDLGGPLAYIPAGLTFPTEVGSTIAQTATVSNAFNQIASSGVPAGIQITNTSTEIAINGRCEQAGDFQATIWITNQWGVSSNAIAFSVDKARPVVDWNPPLTIQWGAALDTNIHAGTASQPGQFSYAPPAGTIPEVGPQMLNLTFTPYDSANYESVTVSRQISVTKAKQQIEFSPPSAIVLGDPAIALAGSSSSGLPVRFDVIGGPGELSGSQLRALAGGTITVEALQDGDAHYEPAAPVAQLIEVRLRPQIASTDGGTVLREPNTETIGRGSLLVLTAIADSGFTFAGWTGDVRSGNNPLNITVTNNVSIMAVFHP